jgi:L-fuconolactonase
MEPGRDPGPAPAQCEVYGDHTIKMSTMPIQNPRESTRSETIDAHVHIWDPSKVEYGWLAEAPQLDRRFVLADVGPTLDDIGIDRVVLVQAADTIAEAEHMLDAADHDPRVAGVVAWVPIDDVAAAATTIDRWGPRKLVGARHMAHRDPNPDRLLSSPVAAVLDLLADRDLTFDVCAETTHLLALVPTLAARHPRLTLIIDHLAKPPIASGGWQPWADLFAEAASAPRVYAKLSGLNTVAGPGATADTYRRYVDHALDVFGPSRLMYGGDWPFALLAAETYGEIWTPLRRSLDALGDDDLDAVLGLTARHAYKLSDQIPGAAP